jgi:hypothetical protein
VVNSPLSHRPQILAAFEVSNFVPGSVYIEARDIVDVSTAICGLNGVPRTPHVDFVPLEDRPALLNCHTISKVGKWVRVKGPGKHSRNLVFVTTVDRAENKAIVLLVPRQPHASPSIFDPWDSGLPFKQLDDGGVVFEGKTYSGGLVEMSFADHRLRLVIPTAEELDVFDRSQGLEASVMAKAWSTHSARALTPESRVRVVSSEQLGLAGSVLTISGEFCAFLPDTMSTVLDVHLYYLRLHFRVGDYVRVKAGRFAGSVSWVTDVERRADADIVTLFDEASAANKEPKEVSISDKFL